MSGSGRVGVVVFADGGGWHERRLTRAFEARGVRCRTVPLHRCCLDPSSPTAGIAIPGFEHSLPEAAFVRGINAGSFEQVTFRLTVLHALKTAGVYVYNDARTIERTVDKGMTSWLLAAAEVPSAPAWTCESQEKARTVAKSELEAGQRLVLKPLFGSRGKGLALIESLNDLPPETAVGGVYHLQRFVDRPAARPDAPHEDWRVMVIAGRAVAAMRRSAQAWITNRAQGGRCESARLDEPLAAGAIAAASAVGAAYAGVDLVERADGEKVVLEVNGIPAFKGLQNATGVDVADALAADLLQRAVSPRLAAI